MKEIIVRLARLIFCPSCNGYTPHSTLSNGNVICGHCGTEH